MTNEKNLDYDNMIYVDEQDISDVEELLKINLKIKELQAKEKKIKEKIKKHYSSFGQVRTGNVFVAIWSEKGLPDKTITEDMVGNIIKGRRGTTKLKIAPIPTEQV